MIRPLSPSDVVALVARPVLCLILLFAPVHGSASFLLEGEAPAGTAQEISARSEQKPGPGGLAQRPGLSSADSIALSTVAAVVDFFKIEGDAAWSGYDLAKRPFVVYLPGRWTLLVNPSHSAEGFSPYPDTWPRIDASAMIHRGPLGNLSGQLVFDLEIDSVKTAAVPLSLKFGMDRRAAIEGGFAFIVHEMFHQFQRDSFRSIPDDQPDEHYPILDSENTALASLEMHILMDAVRESVRSHRDVTSELAREFVAVRRERWGRGPEFFPAFERPQELVEGTAKYVEDRCIDLMGEFCREADEAESPAACDVFEPLTLETYLMTDFENRLSDGAIEPPDMARNRVYPTASAVCVLLDYFKIDWKDRASDPADSPGLAEMLGAGLGMDGTQADSLVARAKRRYDYDALRAACDRLSRAYPLEYQAAVDSLKNLPGFHISVDVSISGLSRSRSCEGKRWVLVQPTRSFSKKCQAYTLRHSNDDDLFIEVHDSGIAEETNAEGTERRVLFVAPSVQTLQIDGKPVDITSKGNYRFAHFALAGTNFSIRYAGPGSLAIDGFNVDARLIPLP